MSEAMERVERYRDDGHPRSPFSDSAASGFAVAELESSIDDVKAKGLRISLRLVGLLLLAASLLKLHSYAASSATFTIAAFLLVVAEALVGIWIAFGRRKRAAAWTVALIVYAIFGCVSLASFIGGQPSCGCFGRIEVSPAASLVIDVLAVALLLRFPPRFVRAMLARVTKRQPQAWFFWGAAAASIASIVGISAIASIAWRTSVATEDKWATTSHERKLVANPSDWIGRSCPLLPYIRFATQTDATRAKADQLTLVLYRRGCSTSEELLATAHETAMWQGYAAPTIFVEVSGTIAKPPPSKNGTIVGVLPNGLESSLPIPVTLTIRKGIVTSAVGG